MSFISNLEWRHATKAFDTSRTLSQEQIHAVLNAIRMAPTSFGLQPFKIFIVRSDQALKSEISKAAFNQVQIIQAPLTIVFCSDADLKQRIDDYVSIKTKRYPEQADALQTLKSHATALLLGLSPEQQAAWAAKQSYIALGFALAACAEMQIDSCPMEGFDANAVDHILNLPSNLHTQAILTVGYRSAEPAVPKFRMPDELLLAGMK